MAEKIPFVDDEPEIRSLVAATLQGVGYEVLAAADAGEARFLAGGVSLGLIRLDLNLSGESGLA